MAPRPPALAVLTGVVACAVAVAALAAAGCGPDAPPEPPPPAQAPALAERPAGPPPTPFDASDVVFEPATPEEPPESVVEIPPRPPAPAPRALPPGLAPPPPPPSARGLSGSCDVRASEGFCFTFTGDGWTPQAARAQCDAAPESSFGAGACPLADRVATCAFERPSAPGREIVYVYYAPYDLALAELACPGTFTALE